MKFTKLSLIAAIAVTTAMAGDAKISGDAKLFYGTDDAGATDLFNKNGAYGDTAVSLDYTRDVGNGVTLNTGITGVSTLGLENELVSGTWINHGPTVVKDRVWLDTANIAVNMGKSTVVVGRQELDTPFFKSEKWNIAANTFDAAVLVNQDIEKTTLVGAWVGRGNGTAFNNPGQGGTVNLGTSGINGGMVGFTKAVQPAYAVGAITAAIPMTTLQVWGYKIPSVATAQWVQADVEATKEVSVGLQYAGAKLTASSAKTSAVAAKLGYATGPLSVSAAYSQRDDKAGIDIANIATGHTSGSESNLYTESSWNYGLVGAQGAKAFKVAAGYDLGSVNLGLSYVNSDSTINANDLKNTILTVSTKVGPLNADVALINQTVGTASSSNTALVRLTAPFSL